MLSKSLSVSKLALFLLLFSMFNLHAGTYSKANYVIHTHSHSTELGRFLKINSRAVFVSLFQSDVENDFIDTVDVELELDQINSTDSVSHSEFTYSTKKLFTCSITLPNKSKIPLYILFCNWKYDMN